MGEKYCKILKINLKIKDLHKENFKILLKNTIPKLKQMNKYTMHLYGISI